MLIYCYYHRYYYCRCHKTRPDYYQQFWHSSFTPDFHFTVPSLQWRQGRRAAVVAVLGRGSSLWPTSESEQVVPAQCRAGNHHTSLGFWLSSVKSKGLGIQPISGRNWSAKVLKQQQKAAKLVRVNISCPCKMRKAAVWPAPTLLECSPNAPATVPKTRFFHSNMRLPAVVLFGFYSV